MEAGDILCLYTDGVTETTSMDGEEFGEAGLLGVLCECRDCEAASILKKVGNVVEQFRSGEQEDDLAMVVARAR